MKEATRPELASYWKLRGRELDLRSGGVVMGILNVTPDSFSDGGRHAGVEAAVVRAREMVAEGAGILDVGGESTRPGAEPVGPEEELKRTEPVVRAIAAELPEVPISIDTTKASVARAALEAGAHIVNDVSGLRMDPEMESVCVEAGCGVVVMHMQGEPRTMQHEPRYVDVMSEVREFFETRRRELVEAGIDERCLCFDPGIGFGKGHEHNLELLRRLDELVLPGIPLMLGISRKSFIGRCLGDMDLSLRDWPTVALTVHGGRLGAKLHRVHEVKGNVEALRMAEAIEGFARH